MQERYRRNLHIKGGINNMASRAAKMENRRLLAVRRGSSHNTHARGLTQKKAGIILKEGEVRGKKLTAKQKRFFGAVRGGQQPRI